MVELLGVSWRVAGSVVVATIAMYLLLVVLIKVLGQRNLLGMSSLDLGCVLTLGAVIGRTALLATPTLLSGVIAVCTLFSRTTCAARASPRTICVKPSVSPASPG